MDRSMMGSGVLWAATALMLATSTACYAVCEGRIDHREGIDMYEPEELFRADGRSRELWSSNARVLRDANVGAARVTLEPQGLRRSKYSDAPQVAYVLEGKRQFGSSFPWDESVHIRSARNGDVIAIPQGIGHWCCNSDDRRFIVLSVVDTSNGVHLGDYDMFYLNGGRTAREFRSVLHGSDEEFLSQAWDTECGEVSDYIYNIDDAKLDIVVEYGGKFQLLTNTYLPIWRDVRLPAIRVKLDREIMLLKGASKLGYWQPLATWKSRCGRRSSRVVRTML